MSAGNPHEFRRRHLRCTWRMMRLEAMSCFVASTTSSHSQLTVPAGTLAGGRSFVLVYCENALGRATSAASVAFSDWALSVPPTTRTLTTATTTSSTVTFTVTDQLRAVGTPSFTDHDPAVYQLNGTVSWIPPADTSPYLHYGVWLLTRRDYSTSVLDVLSTGVQVDDPTTPDGNVPLGTNQLAFAQSRDLGSNGYAQFLAVIPNRVDNDLAASYSQAGFVSIVDLPLLNLGALEVQSVSFSDEDSVATYVRGTVHVDSARQPGLWLRGGWRAVMSREQIPSVSVQCVLRQVPCA